VWGQINITSGSSITETFTALNGGATTMPTGWKVDQNTGTRTLGTYSGAATATGQTDGNGMPTNASAGIYKFQANNNQNEVAVGGLSSSSGSKSVNVYVALKNNAATTITSFNIGYGVEKYRNGTNAAGFSIQMYYSTNGTSWTSAGSSFLTSFAADANSSGFTPAPGTTVTVPATNLVISIVQNSVLYLAWNYSVTSGSTTSNAQALGIDDITIAAISCTTPGTPSSSTTPSTPSVCSGNSVVITGTGSSPSASTYTYWTAATGGSPITTSTTPPGTVASNNLTTPTTLAAGTWHYYVQGENGACISSSRQDVVVTINPFPGTANCATPSAACSGTSATITGANSSNATSYTYWDASTSGNQITTSTNPPGTVSSNNLTTPTTLIANSYTYYVQGENACGSSPARQSVMVTISDAPLTPTCSTPAAVCYGNTVTITGAGAGASASYTYWDALTGGTQITSGVSGGNLTTSSSLSAGAHDYFVQGEVGSCFSARQTVTVTINALPADPPAPVAATNPVCNSTTLSESPAPGGVTYYWQGTTNGGASPITSNNASANYTANTTGTNSYYLRAQDNTTLCWSPAGSAGALSVTIVTSIPSQPSFTSGATSLCQGVAPGTYAISAVSSAADYVWSLSSAGSSSILPNGATTNTTATVTWDAAFSGTATVSVVANNACGSSTAGTRNITVNPTLVPAVSITANPSGAICQGTNVSFTPSPTNGGTPSYQWSLNGGTPTIASSYSSATLANGDIIRCTMSSTATCASPSSANASVTMAVNSLPSSPPAPTAAANPACISTLLSESAPPGGITYFWQGTSNGGSSPSSANSTGSSYTANTAGTNTYYVRARDNTTL
jgi:hypothetical protein